MDSERRFVVRYQMLIFVLLTLLISWSAVIPMGGALIPHGPMIAAFIVLALVSGRPGVSRLWRQMVHWRVHWKWYLIAPGIIIVLHLSTLSLSLMQGAEIDSTAHLRSLPAYLAIVAPLLLLGGQWEEPGWLGYVLRRFQQRLPRSPLLAVLAAGAIRMFWHTPLLLYGSIPWYDYLFYTFALQIFVTWIYNRTGGSVLLPMICHLFSNIMMASIAPMFDSADLAGYWIVYTVVASLMALGIVIATRGTLGLGVAGAPQPAFSAD